MIALAMRNTQEDSTCIATHSPHPMEKPPRNTFAAQIAITQQHLEGAQLQHETESLALLERPDDVDQQLVVEGLEAEIIAHRKTIARLQAAELASAKQVTGEQRAAERELRVGRLAQLKKLDRKVEERTLQIVQTIESLAPGLLELGVLLGERSQLSWAVISAEIGSDEAMRRYGSGLMSTDNAGDIASALVRAIVSSGLGVVGVSLAPQVIVTEPGIAFDDKNFSVVDALRKRTASRDGMINGAIKAGGNEA